jgi:hypothetical protein
MQDLIELLIAFILGVFMKPLLGTVCQSRLVEGIRCCDESSIIDTVIHKTTGMCNITA